jgi:hypothetical protein
MEFTLKIAFFEAGGLGSREAIMLFLINSQQTGKPSATRPQAKKPSQHSGRDGFRLA